LIESEKGEDGNITLLYPRFKNEFFLKWLVPKTRSPFIKITLDTFGSAFWNECDGTHTVYDIGLILKEKFGESIEPVFKRLQLFISHLRKNECLDLEEKE
jgi:hypothetical protein